MSSNFELTAVWEDDWNDDYAEDAWYEDDAAFWPETLPAPPPLQPTAVIFLIPLLLMILGGIFLPRLQTRTAVPDTAVTATTTETTKTSQFKTGDPQAFANIYDNYTITQGPHGQSYGHSAIDIAAGRGEPIKSPINGIVTQFYVDPYNNPTLVIENDVYTITMLHGDFSASLGEKLQIGDQVGTEGNNGYTMDMAGNLCYGRVTCGNHTHLNVYDKRLGANVNPLTLIEH